MRKAERAHTIWSAKGQVIYAEEGHYEEWSLMSEYLFDCGRVLGTLSVSCALANNSKAVLFRLKKGFPCCNYWLKLFQFSAKIAWSPEGMILRGQLAGPRHKLSHRPKEWLLVPFHRFLPIGVLWLKHAQRLIVRPIHSTQRLLCLSVGGRVMGAAE